MRMVHRGSCHCGTIRFECTLDLENETSRCNCSICLKQRFWKSIVPANDLRIAAGADELGEYQFGKKSIHHYFCKRCGVKPFGRGRMEPIGEFYAINVAALDDLSPEQLAHLSIVYQDGLHDRWDRPAPFGEKYL